MSLKDKWELSLKSMNVLLASLNKPNELLVREELAVPQSTEAYEAEIRERERVIKELFERHKRRRLTQEEAAEEVLDALDAGLPIKVPEA